MGVIRAGMDYESYLLAEWNGFLDDPKRARASIAAIANRQVHRVLVRGALPHMHNRRALREIARVLRPGGLLLLKLSAAPFYLRDLRRGLAHLDFRQCLHAIHALVGGVIYHALGSQIGAPIITTTFQTEWMLKRELRRVGMRITMPMADSSRVGPSFAIEKDDR